MPRKETKDKKIAKRLDELREKMAEAAIVPPEDWTPLDREEFLSCISEIVMMEREIAAIEAIEEAINE